METLSNKWQTRLVPCNLCSSLDSKTLWIKDSFRYARCMKCGLIYVNPQLLADEIVRIYEIGYASKTALTPSRIDLITHQHVLGLTRPYRRTNRWLDVGCFNGNLLLTAQTEGWKPFGTEISAPAVEFARSQGIDVFEGSLLEANFPDNWFDVVTLSDVIEHLDIPKDYLCEIQRILRPGGLLYMDTPNFNSLVRRWLGKKGYSDLWYTAPNDNGGAGWVDCRMSRSKPMRIASWRSPA